MRQKLITNLNHSKTASLSTAIIFCAFACGGSEQNSKIPSMESSFDGWNKLVRPLSDSQTGSVDIASTPKPDILEPIQQKLKVSVATNAPDATLTIDRVYLSDSKAIVVSKFETNGTAVAGLQTLSDEVVIFSTTLDIEHWVVGDEPHPENVTSHRYVRNPSALPQRVTGQKLVYQRNVDVPKMASNQREASSKKEIR